MILELLHPLSLVAWLVRRFVVLSPDQAAVVALWIAHTHSIDAFEQTPYLAITSAEKRSGKTRKLEVVGKWGDTSGLDEALAELGRFLGAA